MLKDIRDATVRLAPDEAYDRASAARPHRGTVIVPRSDEAGRQDGRIPPGLAAEMGLVPRLREIGGKDMAYLSRKEAADSGKSGDELYADFYASRSGSAGQAGPAGGRGRGALTPEEKVRILTDAGYTVTPDGRVIPPPAPGFDRAPRGSRASELPGLQEPMDADIHDSDEPVRPSRPARPLGKAARTASAKAGARQSKAKAGARPASRRAPPASATGAGRPPPARAETLPVRVHRAVTGDDGADTLDGFYDELRGSGLGTDEVRRSAENAGRGASGGLPAAPVPRAHGEDAAGPFALPDDVVFEKARQFALERDEARAAYAGLRTDYLALLQREAGAEGVETEDLTQRNVELQDENDRLQDLERDYAELAESYKVADFRLRQKTAEVELLRKSASPASEPSSDTVRVQLGAEPELLWVKGADADGAKWETALTGHVDFSRTGGECVLSVLDPKYASELLAQIRTGDVMLVNGSGRGTACAYSGVCDKIYGDPASSDFITLFRFRVSADAPWDQGGT